MVEVLVVIGIIAILTVIIFPSISNIRAKNRDAERVSDIAAIQLGLALYKNQQNGVYPADIYASDFESYVTSDSLITPDGGKYKYVPLTRDTSGLIKCTYYHLGIQLELPSAQIDGADDFDSSDKDNITNSYKWCGDDVTEGIDGKAERIYHVRP